MSPGGASRSRVLSSLVSCSVLLMMNSFNISHTAYTDHLTPPLTRAGTASGVLNTARQVGARWGWP